METGLQKLNHQQKAVQRGARIASCRSSGLTVRQWCSENGISAGSYYKWQRRLYQMTAGDGPQFIEVTPHQPARNPAAVIHIRDTKVEMDPNRILRPEVRGKHRAGRQPGHLAYAMQTLSHCFICGHVHDELIIECSKDVSIQAICDQTGRTPPWLPGIELRADGYECQFYKE